MAKSVAKLIENHGMGQTVPQESLLSLLPTNAGSLGGEHAVTVTLAGSPRGKGRPRFRYVQPKGKPGFVHTYTDPETKAYEEALAWRARAAWRGRPPLDGPLGVRMFAMMPVPASWSNKKRDAALQGAIFHTSKPDDDNIRKVLDAFNKIIWIDDAQVCRSVVIKEYGEHPGLIVEVYKLL